MDANQKINTDIDTSFEPSLSLWSLLGNCNKIAIDILKTTIDQHFNDVGSGGNPTLPSILLTGRTGCGTVARACSNDFGQLKFKEAIGQTLGMGEDIYSYFQMADPLRRSDQASLSVNSAFLPTGKGQPMSLQRAKARFWNFPATAMTN